LPTLKTEGLRGGAVYYDGQFDDARLLIHMVATAFEQGATLLNYVEVTGLTKDAQGFVDGISARDVETGNEFRATAKVVVNATGAFSDRLRLKAEPSAPMIVPSQGIHWFSMRVFCRVKARSWFHTPAMAAYYSRFRGTDTRSSEPRTLPLHPQRWSPSPWSRKLNSSWRPRGNT
jgi:glycerol-3-phosphate dehydrogenase